MDMQWHACGHLRLGFPRLLPRAAGDSRGSALDDPSAGARTRTIEPAPTVAMNPLTPSSQTYFGDMRGQIHPAQPP